MSPIDWSIGYFPREFHENAAWNTLVREFVLELRFASVIALELPFASTACNVLELQFESAVCARVAVCHCSAVCSEGFCFRVLKPGSNRLRCTVLKLQIPVGLPKPCTSLVFNNSSDVYDLVPVSTR